MENMDNGTPRRANPRRKKTPPIQKMIRDNLPVIGIALGIVLLLVLFIIFAVGSIRRANEKRELARQESLAVESSIAQQQLEWEQEAARLVKEADDHAKSCDFEKAIAVLDTFSGNADDFEVLVAARQRYQNGDSSLVVWEDITTVPNLSFPKLFPDPEKAFVGSNGDSNRYYNISTTEFTAILQQLYDNDFMIVSLYDLCTTTKTAEGVTLIVKNELKLPAGKKPIILTHSQPDGFEYPLVVDDKGNFTSKVTTESGDSYVSNYDFVPLLEDFIATHPGFSYKGARAILAVTGHNGLFGYPLEDTANINAVTEALREKGYIIAGSTYGNIAVGKTSLLELQDDIASWESKVKPLLGDVEIMAYPRSSDISNEKGAYSNSNKKYEKLYVAGFRYYMGLCYNSTPWMSITDNTVRQGRLMVCGGYLKEKSSMFANLFDAAKVLNPQ